VPLPGRPGNDHDQPTPVEPAMRREVMTNPFEDEQASFHVLVNDEGQHSLWPAFAEIPAGWSSVHGADSRQSCVDYVERNWTDMRPKSLIAAMERSS
jgi:MbtH protein